MGFNMDKKINASDVNIFNFNLKNTMVYLKPKYAQDINKYYKFKNYTDPVKFVEGRFVRGTTGIIAMKEKFYFEIFRNEFQRLFEAGITSVANDRYTNEHNITEDLVETLKPIEFSKDFTVYDEKKELVPLSLSQLSAGFIIWLTAVMSAILVFILEFVHYKCSEVWEKFLLRREEKVIMENEKRSRVKNSDKVEYKVEVV